MVEDWSGRRRMMGWVGGCSLCISRASSSLTGFDERLHIEWVYLGLTNCILREQSRTKKFCLARPPEMMTRLPNGWCEFEGNDVKVSSETLAETP
jgi:hypothetical protein